MNNVIKLLTLETSKIVVRAAKHTKPPLPDQNVNFENPVCKKKQTSDWDTNSNPIDMEELMKLPYKGTKLLVKQNSTPIKEDPTKLNVPPLKELPITSEKINNMKKVMEDTRLFLKKVYPSIDKFDLGVTKSYSNVFKMMNVQHKSKKLNNARISSLERTKALSKALDTSINILKSSKPNIPNVINVKTCQNTDSSYKTSIKNKLVKMCSLLSKKIITSNIRSPSLRAVAAKKSLTGLKRIKTTVSNTVSGIKTLKVIASKTGSKVNTLTATGPKSSIDIQLSKASKSLTNLKTSKVTKAVDLKTPIVKASQSLTNLKLAASKSLSNFKAVQISASKSLTDFSQKTKKSLDVLRPNNVKKNAVQASKTSILFVTQSMETLKTFDKKKAIEQAKKTVDSTSKYYLAKKKAAKILAYKTHTFIKTKPIEVAHKSRLTLNKSLVQLNKMDKNKVKRITDQTVQITSQYYQNKRKATLEQLKKANNLLKTKSIENLHALKKITKVDVIKSRSLENLKAIQQKSRLMMVKSLEDLQRVDTQKAVKITEQVLKTSAKVLYEKSKPAIEQLNAASLYAKKKSLENLRSLQQSETVQNINATVKKSVDQSKSTIADYSKILVQKTKVNNEIAFKQLEEYKKTSMVLIEKNSKLAAEKYKLCNEMARRSLYAVKNAKTTKFIVGNTCYVLEKAKALEKVKDAKVTKSIIANTKIVLDKVQLLKSLRPEAFTSAVELKKPSQSQVSQEKLLTDLQISTSIGAVMASRRAKVAAAARRMRLEMSAAEEKRREQQRKITLLNFKPIPYSQLSSRETFLDRDVTSKPCATMMDRHVSTMKKAEEVPVLAAVSENKKNASVREMFGEYYSLHYKMRDTHFFDVEKMLFALRHNRTSSFSSSISRVELQRCKLVKGEKENASLVLEL